MKKIVLLFMLLTTFGVNSHAQSMYGSKVSMEVKMNYLYSLDEALQKANETNKLIFFNCFADWALPCHSMNKLVFSNQKFADWMNKHFVNLLIDVSTIEGRPLAEKYDIRFMAHYLILDSKGEIVHRIVGGSEIPEFQNQLKSALNPKTSLRGMNKRYERGERDINFLREYIRVLSNADEETKADTIQNYYLNRIKMSDLAKSENWFIFQKLVKDIDNKWFDYLLENKKEFVKNNGLDKINDLISNAIIRAAFPYIMGSEVVNLSYINRLQQIMDSMELPHTEECRAYFKLAQLRSRKQYDKLLEHLKSMVDTIQNEIASNIDLSLLNISDLTSSERQLILDYLTKRMTKMEGSTQMMYEEAIREIKNENGIRFIKSSVEEAQKKAQQEHKLIFMDCYTTWCGPCKMLSKKIFTKDTVGNYFNQRFINIKVDMETTEGKELAKRYNIKSYPTLLLLNPDGTLVHKIIGAVSAYELLRKIHRGTSPTTAYMALKKRFETETNYSPEFFTNYLIAMEDAGEINNPNEQAEAYFRSLPLKTKLTRQTWTLLQNFARNSQDSLTDFMLLHRNEMVKHIDMRDFDWKLESILCREMLIYLQEQKTFDVKLDELIKRIECAGLPDTMALSYWAAIFGELKQKQMSRIVSLYTEKISKIQDARAKLNLDILWLYMLPLSNQQQKQEVLAYLERAHKKADPRAVNKYKELLAELKHRL